MKILLLLLFLVSNAWAGYSPWGDIHWKSPVASSASLPASGNVSGDVRLELTAFGMYYWDGSSWNEFTGGGGGGGVTAVTASSPLASSGGSAPNLTCQSATTSQNGCLSSTDWNTFNGKQSALSFIDSVTDSGGNVSLVGDSSSPGNSYYYGTNGSGTKGFYTLPAGTPGGSNSDVQYNSSNSFAGNSSFTYDGSGGVTATTFNGALNGNASTATALASAPTKCSGAAFSQGIDSSGNATCASPLPSPSPSSYLGVVGGVWVPVPAPSGGGGSSYTFSDSLLNTGGIVTLQGDSASPSASNYYGTNGSATLGYYAFPTFNQNTTGSAGSLTQSLTSGLPVIGNGTGITTGTKSGTTTEFGTVSGSLIPGNTVVSDSGGNLIDGGATPMPSPSGSGTVPVYDGSAVNWTNSVLVSQAQLIGQVKITGCSSLWGTASTSLTASLGTPTGCIYTVTPNTQCTAPSGGNTAAILCPSLAPGSYVLKYEGTAEENYNTAAGAASFQFWDGTNTANETSLVGNSFSGSAINAPGFQNTISYSSPQTNVNFAIRAATSNAGSFANIGGTASNPGVISVYYFPTQAQAAQTVATSPANWSGTSTLSGTTTSGSIADVTTALSGSVTTTASSNISCSAASGVLGWTCTGSGIQSGSTYHVCYSGSSSATTTGYNTSTQLTDNSNSVITGVQNNTLAATNDANAFHQCGNYTSSSTSITFKLRASVGSGTATITPSTFSISSLSTPVNAVTITNGVSTNASGNWRLESSTVINNCSAGSTGSPSVTNGTGLISTPSSANCNAVGDISLTFANAFSAAPVCVCTASNAGTVDDCNIIGAVSTTGLRVFTSSTSVGLSTLYANIICQGPR